MLESCLKQSNISSFSSRVTSEWFSWMVSGRSFGHTKFCTTFTLCIKSTLAYSGFTWKVCIKPVTWVCVCHSDFIKVLDRLRNLHFDQKLGVLHSNLEKINIIQYRASDWCIWRIWCYYWVLVSHLSVGGWGKGEASWYFSLVGISGLSSCNTVGSVIGSTSGL